MMSATPKRSAAKRPKTLLETMTLPSSLIQFSGHHYIRHRLVLSILSGKPIRIDKIRPDDKNPGLRGIYSKIPPSQNLMADNLL